MEMAHHTASGALSGTLYLIDIVNHCHPGRSTDCLQDLAHAHEARRVIGTVVDQAEAEEAGVEAVVGVEAEAEAGPICMDLHRNFTIALQLANQGEVTNRIPNPHCQESQRPGVQRRIDRCRRVPRGTGINIRPKKSPVIFLAAYIFSCLIMILLSRWSLTGWPLLCIDT